MAENSSQSEEVPQGKTPAKAPDLPTAPESDAAAVAGSRHDDAKAEALVDGDRISEEDIKTLLNAAAGALPDPPGTTSAASESDGSPETQPFDFPELGSDESASIDPKRVTMLNDVNLRVRLQLGQTRMYLEDVLKLSEGSVVELDKLAGDPVDVLVNDRLIARGEVLVLNDVFCVRICEVLSNDPHRITV